MARSGQGFVYSMLYLGPRESNNFGGPPVTLRHFDVLRDRKRGNRLKVHEIQLVHK